MPNKLTRYGIRLTPVDGVWGHVMTKVLGGEFVKYEDYAALEKERDAACENWQKQCAAMQQKLAGLAPDESELADRHIEWLNTLQRPMFSDEDWEELTLYTWLAFRDSYRIHRAAILRKIEETK